MRDERIIGASERGALARGSRRFLRTAAVLACLIVGPATCGITLGSASAAPALPGWSIQAVARPTSFAATDNAGFDHYTVLATNIGSATSQGTVAVADQVPAGLAVQVQNLQGRDLESGQALSCAAAAQTVECTLEGPVAAGDILEVRVPVDVEAGTPPGPLPADVASVAGGGAPARSTSTPTLVGVPSPFGVAEFSFLPFAADGTPATQAADHPEGVAATFNLATVAEAESPYPGERLENIVPTEDPKNALAYLPLGLAGDPTVLPQCKLVRAESDTCPTASQVGDVVIGVESQPEVHATIEKGLNQEVSGLYNLAPERGYPAEFGFTFFSKLVTVYAGVLHTGGSGGGYDLRVGAAGIPVVHGLRVNGITLSFFGDPAERDGGATPAAAFLTNPSDCSAGPLDARLEVDSWQDPDRWATGETQAYPAMSGCEALQFHPTLQLRPQVTQADTPSGYEVNLKIPQAPNVAPALATPDLEDARVTLPAGVVLSPSAANGLGACAATGPQGINIGSDQIGPAGEDLGDPEATELGAGHPRGNGSPYDDGIYHTAPGHCPGASQIGELEIKTPLLTEPLEGHVYVAKPGCGNSGQAGCTEADATDGTLYGIYLEAAGSGVIVKLHGEVAADPQTGQLTATFSENPQLPFEEFRLTFDGGPSAALANPQTCGTFRTSSDLTPWSAPQTADAYTSDPFSIASGAGGSACVSGEAQAPNRPSFEAGTVSALAGSYSPFVLKVFREDGSQRLRSLNVTLPEGLLAHLAGTPYCSDAAIAAAAGTSGAAQLASPSCPTSSQVGTVTVGAGPGSGPYYVSGEVYLAGPYKGAPLSLAIITSAVAGPFDLGTVVVRTALYVNETTAQVRAVSDQFPTILDGTPLDIRSIALSLDKSQFTLNPTSCEEMLVSGEAVSAAGQAAPLENKFQAVGCEGLAFKPKLALRVFGKTDRNSKPRFRAVLQSSPGEADIARAQVNLPHSLFLEQAHIKTVCTRVQFAAGGGHGEECPTGSIYGHARALTPLLGRPLEGPVYLRSSSHKLPDLVAALNGQIDVDLDGKVDSGPNQGLRNTFEVVPDAPVSKFILELKGGGKGLLVNSEDLCSKIGRSRRAIVRFVGQNGRVEQSKPKVADSCHNHRRNTRPPK